MDFSRRPIMLVFAALAFTAACGDSNESAPAPGDQGVFAGGGPGPGGGDGPVHVGDGDGPANVGAGDGDGVSPVGDGDGPANVGDGDGAPNAGDGDDAPGDGDDPAGDGDDSNAGWTPDYFPTEAWQERTPEEMGYDPVMLEAAVDFATGFNTQALLVIQDGYIISEGYFRGFGADETHESFSMAKSFTSGLVGIAIGEGHLSGVDELLCDYYDDWDCADSADPRSRITLEHVMTLGSGLDWTEDWSSGSLAGNDAIIMSSSGNPVSYVLAKPAAREPGTGFQYSTGDPALITGVLQQATGMTAFAYLQAKVLTPIGADSVRWNSDGQGRTTTFAGMQATARDYARYGFLYLNRGKWDGQQLVPADWVDVSTQHKSSLEPWYGYLWHVDLATRFENPALPSDGYTAKGVQGQLITVIPSERMVVVRLASDGFGGDGFDDSGFFERLLAAKP